MADGTEGVKVLLGDQRKGVLALSIPIAIALFVQNLNNIVDSFWVSDLGQNAMASLGIVYPVYCILIGIGNGLGIGVSAAIARNIGMKNHDNANGVAAQGLLTTLMISVVLTVFLVITAEPVIVLMGGGEMVEECLSYGLPIYLGSFFIILSGVMSGMLRGEGAARRSMAIQVVGAAINIVLDPIMIFWMDMGVAGAAWATVIAFVISSLMAFYWYLNTNSMYVRFERKNFRFSTKLQKEILSVGLPESIELTVMNFFNIFLNIFVVVCAGTAGLAVYTMVWRIGYLTVIPAQAMGGALVAICSAEYGMKEFDMIRDAYRFAIKRSLIMLLALNLVFALLAGVLADVFIRTEDMEFMHDEMVMFTYLMAIFLPPFSMTFVGSSLMQSVEKAGHAMVNTLLRNVFVTIAYWIVSITVCSLFGIGIALIIVESLGGIAMIIHGKIVLERVAKRETQASPAC
ncbi:MAG: MATE family efflux transporter [Candidatus Methanomethylophilaceae archaeon]|nr:MATE family efflux transporter [Candidatus Methanomethylophilaceae archaeon]